jgi:hypothetical protein
MKTILLGLNELNFEFIQKYINKGFLPNFKYLFDHYNVHKTTSEQEYVHLEPWIQWVTVSTGKDFNEHGVFRLGDITKRPELAQIYEKIEEKGFTVGAISPFNVDNRLKKPSFFVPDPWTHTKVNGSWVLRGVARAVVQAVNENASQRLKFSSVLFLILALIKYSSFREYGFYIKTLLRIKLKSSKPLILDKLLSDIFLKEWGKSQPDFSNLFLNSGAHLQHHYMFNSKVYEGNLVNPEWYCRADEDPIYDILNLYDVIVGKLLKLNARLLIATGLHQKPHEHVTFYWRLKKHRHFLSLIGIENIKSVLPRMSRDFLIEFNNEEDALCAQKILLGYLSEVDGEKIFQVDNRGNSLFVELIYAREIKQGLNILGAKRVSNFKDHVSFVAIKNGEHDGIGYLVDTKNNLDVESIPLKKVHDLILEGF